MSGELQGSIDLGAGEISTPLGGFIARLSTADGSASLSAPLHGFGKPFYVRETADGNIILAGHYDNIMSFGRDTWIGSGGDPVALSVTADFNTLHWAQLASTSDLFEAFTGAEFADDQSIFLSGYHQDTLTVEGCAPRESQGDQDAFIMKRSL